MPVIAALWSLLLIHRSAFEPRQGPNAVLLVRILWRLCHIRRAFVFEQLRRVCKRVSTMTWRTGAIMRNTTSYEAVSVIVLGDLVGK